MPTHTYTHNKTDTYYLFTELIKNETEVGSITSNRKQQLLDKFNAHSFRKALIKIYNRQKTDWKWNVD